LIAVEHPPLAHIVAQHLDEAAIVRMMRSKLVHAQHVELLQLERNDERP
jgi:hypothetical protein